MITLNMALVMKRWLVNTCSKGEITLQSWKLGLPTHKYESILVSSNCTSLARLVQHFHVK